MADWPHIIRPISKFRVVPDSRRPKFFCRNSVVTRWRFCNIVAISQIRCVFMKRFTSILVFCLSVFALQAQDHVIISEFMASNSKTLADENGDFSDWIEIYNAGTNTVNLNGWLLADRNNQWSFPATNLPPNSFLIVFASNKNRRVPGRPLHTNF